MTALHASSSKIGHLAATASTKKRSQAEETRAELVRRGVVGRRFAVVGLPLGAPPASTTKPGVDQVDLTKQLAMLGFHNEAETKGVVTPDRSAGVAC